MTRGERLRCTDYDELDPLYLGHILSIRSIILLFMLSMTGCIVRYLETVCEGNHLKDKT